MTERAGTTSSQQQPRLTVSIDMHTEARIEDVCHALTEKPSWACQPCSPYRLQRLGVRKMKEQVRGTERARDGEMENTDTKAKTVTEGYKQRKKENKIM